MPALARPHQPCYAPHRSWADGSGSPANLPSGKDYSGADYAHWGLLGSTAEPDSSGQCVSAQAPEDFGFMPYAYFTGTNKTNAAAYVRFFDEQQYDVNAWADEACTNTRMAICELTGEWWASACFLGCLLACVVWLHCTLHSAATL